MLTNLVSYKPDPGPCALLCVRLLKQIEKCEIEQRWKRAGRNYLEKIIKVEYSSLSLLRHCWDKKKVS